MMFFLVPPRKAKKRRSSWHGEESDDSLRQEGRSAGGLSAAGSFVRRALAITQTRDKLNPWSEGSVRLYSCPKKVNLGAREDLAFFIPEGENPPLARACFLFHSHFLFLFLFFFFCHFNLLPLLQPIPGILGSSSLDVFTEQKKKYPQSMKVELRTAFTFEVTNRRASAVHQRGSADYYSLIYGWRQTVHFLFENKRQRVSVDSLVYRGCLVCSSALGECTVVMRSTLDTTINNTILFSFCQ